MADHPAPGLEQIQRWMLESITHPDGLEAGLGSDAAREQIAVDDLGEMINPSKNLTSHERMRIYSNAYFWRLIDILAEEYPTVRHVVGPPRFGELIVDYVTRHPSTSYTLARLGAGFPDYLEHEAADVPHREFLADVARVERAMEDVFAEPVGERVSIDDLLEIPTEQWAAARFRMITAKRFIELRYPVDPFISAVRDETHMDIPAPEPSWTLVFRRGFRSWRAQLTEVRFRLLGALADGMRLMEALEACMTVPGVDPDEVAGSLQDWFAEWTADGLFTAVSVD